ncbi:hypothetical protein MCUN1_001870 [Malassezia cuniculi]|uniref:SMAD/FHA domain-containing protein n=1 Tax=Malassezia cuniculi TaxID=948313 RepID=A0AAF0J6W8_9BASI|nr:hypothetical protein MCUN1_001870 [Malassezia cuniculi]
MEREIRENGPPLRIGRVTERRSARSSAQTNSPSSGNTTALSLDGANDSISFAREQRMQSRENSRLNFNSKVVSRMHAEIWCESDSTFYIRDTKSSSGTFLNHLRLSPPNVMSKAMPLRDGDIIQFGMDYQGGVENIYRAVRVRVEMDRSPMREVTQYNYAALEQLRKITEAESARKAAAAADDKPAGEPDSGKGTITECCICLMNISVCHAIFSAPCSHMFHYKCIRPLLSLHYPGFQCPLCRTFADLEADVEEETEAAAREAGDSDGSLHGSSTFSQGAGAHADTI